jgi:hypothetical protein
MTSTPKKEYSMQELESRYQDITAMYDFAGELVDTVESKFVSDPEKQLEVVEPLISEIGDATDILAEEFILISEAQKKKSQSKASKSRIEGALRRFYVAINEYNNRVRDTAKKAHGAIQNIADPIVQKIQRQVDKIVVVFLEFIQISLQSLMNKAELEALKLRDTRVAMMMHQMAMAQHQG